jgi:hypothetical protein
MAKSIEKIAAGLGADIIGPMPDTGGGAFGAARLARIVATMQARIAPGQGRLTDANWTEPRVEPSEGRAIPHPDPPPPRRGPFGKDSPRGVYSFPRYLPSGETSTSLILPVFVLPFSSMLS